jgi:hypothetical protein
MGDTSCAGEHQRLMQEPSEPLVGNENEAGEKGKFSPILHKLNTVRLLVGFSKDFIAISLSIVVLSIYFGHFST